MPEDTKPLKKIEEDGDSGYLPTDACTRCEGKCCKLQPGHCLPSEFGSAEAVNSAFESGLYGVILLLESDIKARVVRPHYKDRARMTGCVFLQAEGCKLPWEKRPYGCRMLRPRNGIDENCKPEGISISEAAKLWEESGYLPPMPYLGFD